MPLEGVAWEEMLCLAVGRQMSQGETSMTNLGETVCCKMSMLQEETFCCKMVTSLAHIAGRHCRGDIEP